MATETKQAPAPAASADALKNCAGCNKPIKKAKRFYRNGKYYCNQKCFKATANSKEKEADAADKNPEDAKPEDKKE